jgi:hypothetical protein
LKIPELNRLRFLKTQHKAIVNSGEPDKDIKVGKPSEEMEKIPVFSDEFKSQLANIGTWQSSTVINITNPVEVE